MRKILLALAITATLTPSNLTKAQSNQTDTNASEIHYFNQNQSFLNDTVIVIEPNDVQDGQKIIQVIDGVLKVTSKINPNAGVKINEWWGILAPLATLVLGGIMRRRSIRKMKKRGHLPNDYRVPLG